MSSTTKITVEVKLSIEVPPGQPIPEIRVQTIQPQVTEGWGQLRPSSDPWNQAAITTSSTPTITPTTTAVMVPVPSEARPSVGQGQRRTYTSHQARPEAKVRPILLPKKATAGPAGRADSPQRRPNSSTNGPLKPFWLYANEVRK